MDKFIKRGYYVTENAPVYFTKDMDKTLNWFSEVLGWYGGIDERNEEGIGLYGCTYSIPPALESTHVIPFMGFHMFYGEPKLERICFMKVKGIEQMHQYIIAKGWTNISEIIVQPWGGKTFSLTTIDGSIMDVFE